MPGDKGFSRLQDSRKICCVTAVTVLSGSEGMLLRSTLGGLCLHFSNLETPVCKETETGMRNVSQCGQTGSSLECSRARVQPTTSACSTGASAEVEGPALDPEGMHFLESRWGFTYPQQASRRVPPQRLSCLALHMPQRHMYIGVHRARPTVYIPLRVVAQRISIHLPV